MKGSEDKVKQNAKHIIISGFQLYTLYKLIYWFPLTQFNTPTPSPLPHLMDHSRK